MTSMIFLLFTLKAFAQNTCLELEGINIGCVSSVDHSCYLNKAIDKKGSTCFYVDKPNVMKRVEGPIAWTCKSTRSNTVCVDNPNNGDSSGKTCTTTSECLEYYPPRCNEECVPCFDTVVSENSGQTRGCIICTRKPCPDEVDKLSLKYCPSRNASGLPLGGGDKCSASTSCPTTAVPPNGGQPMNVIVSTAKCEPPKLPEPGPMKMPQLCPWKEDHRSENGCEPIEPSNRNY